MNASMNANASALREYSKACSPSRVVVDRHRHWSTVSASVSHQNLLAPVGRCQQHQRRRLLSSSSKTNKTEPHANSDSNTAKINERGGIWIYLGWSLLGLVGVDQALQYKQEQDDNEKRTMLARMQIDADNASVNVADWDESLPKMFTCKILHVDPGLDGTKMLTRRQNSSHSNTATTRNGINPDIQKGNLVEILEAGVGPSQGYHLCRLQQAKSGNDNDSAAPAVVGWYPIDYLERVD